ncbi:MULTISPECIES: M13 family metallopeptidase [unclassified Duganella]|jgi:putative endopeptidase|uniref:M13 family metallopeptidase n=1 Tax=unclassified Duganella TaxID=2636909 RepID=UPI00088CE866|nr:MULTISPECIES: M13-type metalloendopeptidase [unclassified Duganella]SDG93379.1 Predicted metalloendopeptidase [Duganella sp. OV458]SDJ48987.1 Predicted metalloendopeptidase [Duganella sp. OV510]
MKAYLLSALMAALLASTGVQAQQKTSGVDLANIEPSVRLQDDFFLHLNGKWLAKTEIPSDKSSWGSFEKLDDDTKPQLRAIIEAAAANKSGAPEGQRIGDFFASYMDEARLEELHLLPLKQDFDRIATLNDKKLIPGLIAHFNRYGYTAPYGFVIHQDNKDSTRYVADIYQDGLSLPDRDYYLKKSDKKLADTLVKYEQHVTKMLTLAGNAHPAADAKAIVALETQLARLQWTKVQLRDPVKAYNKVPLNRLPKLAAGYDWTTWVNDTGIGGKTDYVIVSQPSYISGFNKLLNKTPLSTWKVYFQWQVLHANAPYLSRDFVQENFAFYGKVLSGTDEQQPRWKRGVNATDNALGEALGKLYVEQHFPPERKARMEALVKNLLEAYRESINTLDWMGPETKKQAQEKLAKFTTKIGYPNKWRDYSALVVGKGDLVGNVRRAQAFAYEKEVNKLGKPIDRDEWGMTPQTVNAYYNPELNEIVFPAAILQPPFFDADADDAVNYGAIGAVIGHEISHGFDDQGAQYDGDGNLRDWWTKADHKAFAAKTKQLVRQYNAFSPFKGYFVNGELTLGENIADNSGAAIAYKAYLISLNGKPAPVIDGLTGQQRFYMGFGQVWRAKIREAQQIVYLKTDPHSPDQFRANGTVRNQPGFYEAFGVKPGDKMYLAPKDRVIIW